MAGDLVLERLAHELGHRGAAFGRPWHAARAAPSPRGCHGPMTPGELRPEIVATVLASGLAESPVAPDLAEKLQRMVGFRNVAAQRY
jgi:hypothetical protein